MWKIKAMVVLEIMDFNMMDIITNGPHVPTFQERKYGVPTSTTMRTPTHSFSKEDKNSSIWMSVHVLPWENHFFMTYIIFFRIVFQQKK